MAISYCLVLQTLITISLSGCVFGALVERPRNTVGVVGDRTLIKCRTNLTKQTVFWQYTNVKGQLQDGVFTFGKVGDAYSRRNISVETGAKKYDLIFQSVSLVDAGTYTCQDNGGLDETRAAWLTVLEREPECNVNISLNKETRLTCSVSFNGSTTPSNHLSPNATWDCTLPSSVSNNMTWSEKQSHFRRLTSTATLPPTNSSFFCTFSLTFNAESSDDAIDHRKPKYEYKWNYRSDVAADWSTSTLSTNLLPSRAAGITTVTRTIHTSELKPGSLAAVIVFAVLFAVAVIIIVLVIVIRLRRSLTDLASWLVAKAS